MDTLHFFRAVIQFFVIKAMLSLSIRLYTHLSIKTPLYKIWHDRRVKSIQSALDAEHGKKQLEFLTNKQRILTDF